MKKYLLSLLTIIVAAFISFNLVACSEDDEDALGSIYGIVTELGTAEPMRAVGVELYKNDRLLLKTVTFDDGHFEFSDLTPGEYNVQAVADGYEQVEQGGVTVEPSRQARIDLQVQKLKTRMVIRTLEASFDGGRVKLNGKFEYSGYDYSPSEVGFVYDTQNNPKEGGNLVKGEKSSSGNFSAILDDLENDTYYFQAYATNKVGTAYGEVRVLKLKPYIEIENLAVQKQDLGSGNFDIAKEMCAASRIGGFSDWRLPTIYELAILYARRKEIGGFDDDSRYWSSTLYGSNQCYIYEFWSGEQTVSPTEYDYLRAVRAVRTIK